MGKRETWSFLLVPARKTLLAQEGNPEEGHHGAANLLPLLLPLYAGLPFSFRGPISCFHHCSVSLKAVLALLLSLFLPHTPCPSTWRRPKQGDMAAFIWAQIPVWLDFHLILAQRDHASPH